MKVLSAAPRCLHARPRPPPTPRRPELLPVRRSRPVDQRRRARGAVAPIADLGPFNPALSGVSAERGSNRAPTTRSMANANSFGVEMSWPLARGEVFGQLRSTRSGDGNVQVGGAYVPALDTTLPVYGHFGSYDSVALEAGYRHYFGSGRARPHVAGRLGTTHVDKIKADFAIPDAAIALNDVPFYDGGWILSGGADVGVMWTLGERLRSASRRACVTTAISPTTTAPWPGSASRAHQRQRLAPVVSAQPALPVPVLSRGRDRAAGTPGGGLPPRQSRGLASAGPVRAGSAPRTATRTASSLPAKSLRAQSLQAVEGLLRHRDVVGEQEARVVAECLLADRGALAVHHEQLVPGGQFPAPAARSWSCARRRPIPPGAFRPAHPDRASSAFATLPSRARSSKTAEFVHRLRFEADRARVVGRAFQHEVHDDIGAVRLRDEDRVHQRMRQNFRVRLRADGSQQFAAVGGCRPCPEYEGAHACPGRSARAVIVAPHVIIRRCPSCCSTCATCPTTRPTTCARCSTRTGSRSAKPRRAAGAVRGRHLREGQRGTSWRPSG